MRMWYPVMLDVVKRHCLIVGGGRVAERRMLSLVEAGAAVTLIAPNATARIAAMDKDGAVHWLARTYHEGDAAQSDSGGGYALVIAATDAPGVNELVRGDAARAGVLFSAADDPAGGDFIVPAVLRRGALTIAVTTGGESPALAARIRRELESTYGLEYEAYVDFLGEARRSLRERLDDAALRQELLRYIAEWDLLPLIRAGDAEWCGWRERLLAAIEKQPDMTTIGELSETIIQAAASLYG